MKDAQRTMYLQPDEAVAYGLIDKVLQTEGKAQALRPSFMDAL